MDGITRNPTVNRNYDFVVKQGATKPALEVQLTDSDNNAVALDGATVIFRMSEPGSDSYVTDSQAIIDDAQNGVVVYTWTTSDTEKTGIYNSEFVVDYDGGQGSNFSPDEYFPTTQFMTIHIEDSL